MCLIKLNKLKFAAQNVLIHKFMNALFMDKANLISLHVSKVYTLFCD